jgi:hypothetical protein
MSNDQKRRASDYESEGRRFESCRARHRNTQIRRENAKLIGRVRINPDPFDRDLTVARVGEERVEPLDHKQERSESACKAAKKRREEESS